MDHFLNCYWICYEAASIIQFGFWWPCSLWDLSSPTRDQTLIPDMGRWSLNHWNTREESLRPWGAEKRLLKLGQTSKAEAVTVEGEGGLAHKVNTIREIGPEKSPRPPRALSAHIYHTLLRWESAIPSWKEAQWWLVAMISYSFALGGAQGELLHTGGRQNRTPQTSKKSETGGSEATRALAKVGAPWAAPWGGCIPEAFSFFSQHHWTWSLENKTRPHRK